MMNILSNSGKKKLHFSRRFLENEHLFGRETSHHIIVTTVARDTPNLNKNMMFYRFLFSSSKKIIGRNLKYL